MTRVTSSKTMRSWKLAFFLLAALGLLLVVVCRPNSTNTEVASDERVTKRKRHSQKREVGPAAEFLSLPSVEGFVEAAEGGPISGAVVCATPASSTVKVGNRRLPSIGAFFATVCERSRQDGGFSLRTGRGRYLVRAVASGRRPSPGALADVAPGKAVHSIEITLELGGIGVSGSVIDRFGGPIEGALVTSDSGGFVLTNNDGEFVLPVADSHPILVAWRPGYVSKGLPVLAPSSGVILTMVPEAIIEGQVMDPDDQPIAGIEVRSGRDESEIPSGMRRGSPSPMQESLLMGIEKMLQEATFMDASHSRRFGVER